jgi:FixJ family two-component response regulator
MVMPGVSGLDLATDLSREYPGIKILYISGFVESVAMHVIARRSPQAVLLKPFTEQALLERVHQLLEKPPEVGPGAHSV